MKHSRWAKPTAFVVSLILCPATQSLGAEQQSSSSYGLGRPATQAEITGWDIDVRADGKGLPAGSGNVAQGKEIYAERCAACHGENGEGGPPLVPDGPRLNPLTGGDGTLTSDKPIRTVGSYWPYATTLYDYIRRAMPFDAPQSLTPSQVYAATAYILYLNRILPRDTVLDAGSLPLVSMSNRNGFRSDEQKPNPVQP